MPPRKKTIEISAVSEKSSEKPTKLTKVTKVPKTTKPRKSKKEIQVVAVVTPDGIQGNFVPEPRKPLIAHLDIHSNEVVFRDQPLHYDPTPPTQPEPYDAVADNIFATTQEYFEQIEENKIDEEKILQNSSNGIKYEDIPKEETRPIQVFSKAALMFEFANASRNQKLPDRTSIACFWCAHTFENQPCIIPEREVHGVYKAYGNFCCPECAIAYLLNESIDPHVRWERMALLNRIYDTEKIYPAPPRESLLLFGGVLTIESYRSTIRSKKVRIDLHIPPIVSIIGSIDTKPIDFYDTNIGSSKSSITLLPFDRINETQEGLRLKRSKPLKDKASTLDACMNIQIRNQKN